MTLGFPRYGTAQPLAATADSLLRTRASRRIGTKIQVGCPAHGTGLRCQLRRRPRRPSTVRARGGRGNRRTRPPPATCHQAKLAAASYGTVYWCTVVYRKRYSRAKGVVLLSAATKMGGGQGSIRLAWWWTQPAPCGPDLPGQQKAPAAAAALRRRRGGSQAIKSKILVHGGTA